MYGLGALYPPHQTSSVTAMFLAPLLPSYLGRGERGSTPQTAQKSHDPTRPLNLELQRCARMGSLWDKTPWLVPYYYHTHIGIILSSAYCQNTRPTNTQCLVGNTISTSFSNETGWCNEPWAGNINFDSVSFGIY